MDSLKRFVGWFCPVCRTAVPAGRGKRPADFWCGIDHPAVPMDPLFVENEKRFP